MAFYDSQTKPETFLICCSHSLAHTIMHYFAMIESTVAWGQLLVVFLFVVVVV